MFATIKRMREHRSEIKLVLEIIDSILYVTFPALVAFGAYLQGQMSLRAAIYVSIASTITTFRAWIKRSPLTRDLGVRNASMDLPHTTATMDLHVERTEHDE